MATGPLLYSTNVFLKQLIQLRYQSDKHYVWCSTCFDPTQTHAYDPQHLLPPSSSPAAIYQSLRAAVRDNDRHDAKIAQQRLSFAGLASGWYASGAITEAQRDEIAYLLDLPDMSQWRPLVYAIPRAPVEARLKLVPLSQRAGLGEEFIIEDLARSEFDIIELLP